MLPPGGWTRRRPERAGSIGLAEHRVVHAPGDADAAGLRGGLQPRRDLSGEARIELHSENADGGPVVHIDLSGVLRGDRRDAAGSFRTGRAVTLNWHED